jgi:hypothetical protein
MQNQKPEEMVPREQREKMLQQMQEVSNKFYSAAVQIGCHPFIEFCGLMNEYIKLCAQAQKADLDFTNMHIHSGHGLPMQAFHARYVGEKLGCIYGASFSKPDLRNAFLEAVGL